MDFTVGKKEAKEKIAETRPQVHALQFQKLALFRLTRFSS